MKSLLSWLAATRLGDGALEVRPIVTAEDGAVASFAGIHRSVLGVQGIDAVERVVVDGDNGRASRPR